MAHTLDFSKFYAWINARLKELLILSLISLNIMLWLTIVTFDARDPSFNHARSINTVYNMLGIPGAFSADILLMLMGYFAHIILFVLLYKLVQLFINRHQLSLKPIAIFWQILGFITLLTTGCAITYIQFTDQQQMLPAGTGGIIGEFIGNFLITKLNIQNATFLSLILSVFGLTLFIKIKWLYVFEVIGKVTNDLIELFFLGLKNLLTYTNLQYVRYQQELRKARAKEQELLKNRVDDKNQQTTSTINLSKIKATRITGRDPEIIITSNKQNKQNKKLDLPIKPKYLDNLDNAVTNNNLTSKAQVTNSYKDLASIVPLDDKQDLANSNFDSFNNNSFDNEFNTNLTNQLLAKNLTVAKDSCTEFEADLTTNNLTTDNLNTNTLQAKNLTTDDWLNNNFSNDDLFDVKRNDSEQDFDDQEYSEQDFDEQDDSEQDFDEQNYFNQDYLEQNNLKQDIDISNLSPLPELSLLDPQSENNNNYSEEDLYAMSHLLETKLKEFGVPAQVVAITQGPVITMFEIMLGPGIKGSRVLNLERDLARSMAVISVRVVEVIAGKKTIGIEIPNEKRQIINLSSVLQSTQYADASSYTTLALGQNVGGAPVITDLAKTPHLLVAGTTGSGKSVGVNAMILSILFKATPAEVRFIMIDPKMLELSIYEGIPHLLCPVVTDMKEAANALRWAVAEMERRYKLMMMFNVRQLAWFNQRVLDAQKMGKPLYDPFFKRTSNTQKPEVLQPLPLIVIVIDEFADMMITVGKNVEELIARITQKARAAGIHLILATQRPSVDVITGLIKSNIPTRIAFKVSSKIDSRTILDQSGAEQLLGHGDMLFLPNGKSIPIRVHGAFVSDDEVQRVVEAWKLRGTPDYVADIVSSNHDVIIPGEKRQTKNDKEGFTKEQYDEAVEFIFQADRVSISSVQRYLKIGYNKAANIVEAMEQNGIVSSPDKMGRREILVKRNNFD